METYKIKEKIEDLINSDLLESGCSEYTAEDYKKALSEFLIKYKSLEARVGIMSWYEDTWYGNLKEKYVSKGKIKEKIKILEEMNWNNEIDKHFAVDFLKELLEDK